MNPTMFSTTVMRQTTTSVCECKICGASARYSYYGAIVCHSCKMFFRRNAENEQIPLKCEFGNECEIQINNRRICPSCRLAKCFTNGMSIELIRSARAKPNEINLKRKSIADLNSTSSINTEENQLSDQIPIINFLQSDSSILRSNEWNLLFNLTQSFDRYSDYAFVEHFVQDQTTLPLKLRFKYSSVMDFFTSMMISVQFVCEKSRDFLRLSFDDRSILLRTTVQYTTSIGGMLILRQAKLLDKFAFFRSAEMIFQPAVIDSTKYLIDQLDSDSTFLKLILSIVSFSTMNSTIFTESIPINLTIIKAIIPIQYMYTELTWRYLLHHYGHQQAVIRFSNLVKCLVQVNNIIIKAHESKQFTDIIRLIIERTEQKIVQQSNGFCSCL